MNLIKIMPVVIAACALIASASDAQVPQLINYQGRVVVGSTNFDGTGQFKFALVNADGTTTYWSNAPDTSPADGAPDSAVSLTVAKGLYSVLLGDATLTNMAVVPATVFTNPDVRLRVWFDDGTHGMQLLSPDQRIAAVGYAMMSNEVRDGAVTAAKIAPGAVGAGQLGAGAALANLNASGQTAVPTAALVMSNTIDPALVAAGYVNIGSFLSMSGDNWQRKTDPSTNGDRTGHSAVWDGGHMIVWGGRRFMSTGATVYSPDGYRFNPATNTWTFFSPGSNTPTGRYGHHAFWTGHEMLIWGGTSAANTTERSGGRYNPYTNSWRPINTSGSPFPHPGRVALWTGTEMILFGGDGSVDTGGRYNPVTDTWTPMPFRELEYNGPLGRTGQVAVWTGTEMIVWGGRSGSTLHNTGGRYNPSTDRWTPMSVVNAPTARGDATAVWTGGEMIVWGGSAGASGASPHNTGARYNPTSDTWIALPTTNAPEARSLHTAVWNGKEMLAWGGRAANSTSLDTGGRFDPALNTWTAFTTADAPPARIEHSAIMAGADMLIFGGRSSSATTGVTVYKDTYTYSFSKPVYIYQRP